MSKESTQPCLYFYGHMIHLYISYYYIEHLILSRISASVKCGKSFSDKIQIVL